MTAVGRRCCFNLTGILNAHKNLFVPVVRRHLTEAAALRLPDNYQDINAAEIGCFSPLRNRDITSLYMDASSSSSKIIDVTLNDSDAHIGLYDWHGPVSLSSSMQSNVPTPFGGSDSILNMPGSQIGMGYKYMSDYQQTSHYLTLRNAYSRNLASGMVQRRTMTTTTNGGTKKLDEKLTPVQRLKATVAAYGPTVIVFHVAISLVSLGGFYVLVSSGVDITSWLDRCGLVSENLSTKLAGNAGTFVIAYAIHKVFAPVRIGITLTATPFIVRHLRKIGILKTPPKPPPKTS